jgi:hypothetical protein
MGATLYRRFVFILILAAIPQPTVFSQDDNKSRTLENFTHQIDRYQADVDGWQTQADRAFYLGLAIMILGLLGAGGATARTASGKAKDTEAPAKPASMRNVAGIAGIGAIAAGLLVTVTSAVKEYKYPGDPKELQKYARQGLEIVRDMRDIRDQFKISTSRAELDEYQQMFATNVKKFQGIKDRFAWIWHGDHVVYAAARQPSWIAKLPDNPRVFQRVGLGEASDLTAAKQLSFEDAVRQLAADAIPLSSKVRMTQQTQVGAVSDFVAGQATVAGTFFEVDPARKVYRYYTWLRINKEVISPQYLPQGRVQNSVKVPIPAGQSRVTVPVSAPKASEASFEFSFLVSRRSDGTIDLELVQVKTLQDGSTSATRWYFDALVNGIPSISVPESRYDDSPSRNVTTLHLHGTIPAVKESSITLTVSGYKPKDFK